MTGKSDKADIWMPWFIGDYLADTTHLTRDQHGGYVLLLMAMWMKGGRLPDQDGQLGQIAKATPREWRALRPILEPFFFVADGWWTQKRLSKELTGASQRKAKAVAKAIAGANGRWGKPVDKNASSNAASNASSMPQAMPEAMLEQCPLSLPLSTTEVNASNGAGAREGQGERYRPTAKPGANSNWRRDPDAAAARAESLGMRTRAGESTEQLVGRIDAEEAKRREARH